MYKQSNEQQYKSTLELFEMQMIGIKHLSDMLRMGNRDKIKLTHEVFNANGVPTGALPKYVESEVTLSASELLKRNGKPMSAVKFNKLM